VNWPKVTFDQLFLEPQRNGLYKPRQFHGSGAKIVNMGELFAYNFLGPQDMRRVQVNAEELGRFGVEDGDLLFARRSLIEAGAGKCVLVDNLDEPTVFESSLIRVRLDPRRCNPRFYTYYFRDGTGRNAVRPRSKINYRISH
jgi:type I restriction enzyme S subunit